jgi:RNA polymerase sigma-54 factor
MALSPRLDLRQAQTLVMTPQLQQAIKLLQLSNIELSAYVEQQLEQNPFLERADPGHGETGTQELVERPEPLDSSRGPQSVDSVMSDDTGVGSQGDLDGGHENVFDAEDISSFDGGHLSFERDGSDRWNRAGNSFDKTENNLENVLSVGTSLRDHLNSQIAIDITDPGDRVIGSYLVEMLDDAGYLRVDLELTAKHLGCSQDRLRAALDRLQYLDPAGVFARSLSECLALQLRERGRLDGHMIRLLGNLDLIASGEVGKLAKICGVNSAQLTSMIREIRQLNPKPALTFDTVVAQSIVPDVIMRPQQGEGWVVELNNETLPRVLVDMQYYSLINHSSTKKHEKLYIAECYHSANWLVKSLHQRATTILKVATEIIKQQESFFLKGVQALRPLILRDIANAVDMHESTVSRVTSNKYISTPRGIFELKYFFSQALGGGESGTARSAESVRYRIKGLIDAEAADAILSDDTIVEILQSEGIEIARRTVAKYRESMGLQSSVQRRRSRRARV